MILPKENNSSEIDTNLKERYKMPKKDFIFYSMNPEFNGFQDH